MYLFHISLLVYHYYFIINTTILYLRSHWVHAHAQNLSQATKRGLKQDQTTETRKHRSPYPLPSDKLLWCRRAVPLLRKSVKCLGSLILTKVITKTSVLWVLLQSEPVQHLTLHILSLHLICKDICNPILSLWKLLITSGQNLG